jgi:hypothetical protein
VAAGRAAGPVVQRGLRAGHDAGDVGVFAVGGHRTLGAIDAALRPALVLLLIAPLAGALFLALALRWSWTTQGSPSTRAPRRGVNFAPARRRTGHGGAGADFTRSASGALPLSSRKRLLAFPVHRKAPGAVTRAGPDGRVHRHRARATFTAERWVYARQ